MDLFQRGKWALEALENTQDEKLKIDLLKLSLCCGKLALSNNTSKVQDAVDSIERLIALESHFERIVATAGSSRISSPSLGESFYKIDPAPSPLLKPSVSFANDRSRRIIIHEKNAIKESPPVTQQDLLSFEKKFRDKFVVLQKVLRTLRSSPDEVIEKNDIAPSSRDIEILRNRQQQLEDIVDELVARLDKEIKEKMCLLQKLAARG